MTKKTFNDSALEAGFSQDQAEFMFEALAQQGHTHGIEDVEGLEDALEGCDEEEDEEEEAME